jgi:hypothetical protein
MIRIVKNHLIYTNNFCCLALMFAELPGGRLPRLTCSSTDGADLAACAAACEQAFELACELAYALAYALACGGLA